MESTSRKVFGRKLRQLREERELTTREVGNILGFSEATISRYENGLVEPKRTTLQALAQFYNVSPGWLVGEIDEKYPTRKEDTEKIPLLGQIAAGKYLLAEENITEYLNVKCDRHVDFALRVCGDSMVNARILDGDVVYIRKQQTVENGEIAAVLIENEATLKRVYYASDSVILRSENPAFPDHIYTRRDFKRISILGKAIFFESEVR